MPASALLRRALGAAALLLCAAASHAQDAPGKTVNERALTVRALAGDGSPAAGAVVEAWAVPAPRQATWGISDTEPTLLIYASTDANGVANVPSEKPGAWRVTVRAPGRATGARMMLVNSKTPRVETFHLARGFALEGTVAYREGAYAPGVSVYAGPVGWEGDLASFTAKATSDEEGRWRMEGLAKGPIDLWAAAPERGMEWIARFEVPNFTTFPFRVSRDRAKRAAPKSDAAPPEPREAPGGPKVRVRVLDPIGEPLAGATVSLGETTSVWGGGFHVWPPRPQPVVDATGPDGVVVLLAGAIWGEEEIVVRAPGLATARRKVRISSSGPDLAEEMQLARGRDVRVRVVDDAGEPIAGAWLTLGADVEPEPPTISAQRVEDQRTDVFVGVTGKDGAFALPDVGPEPMRVQAKAPGRQSTEARIHSGLPEVVVSPRAYLAITGRLEWEDGTPAGNVTYALGWLDAPPQWPSWRGPFASPPDGSFTIRGLGAGRHRFQVLDDATGAAAAPQYVGPFEAGARDVVVRVRRGRIVRGFVVTAAGVPVPGVNLEITAGDRGKDLLRAREEGSADGTFATTRAPHGPIRIVVSAPLPATRERRVVRLGPIDPKDEVLRIVLEDKMAIEGRLVNSSGDRVADMRISARPIAESSDDADGPANECTTDAEGRFRIAGLDSGTYRLWDAESLGFSRMMSKFKAYALDPEVGTRAGAKDVRLVR